MPSQAPLDPTTAQALERLATVLAQKRQQLDSARTRLDQQAIKDLETDIQLLRWQFAGLAARENVQEFEAPQARQFDLQGELEQLIRPLLKSLKDATATPRQIADLQARVELLQQRQRTAEAAQRACERTRDQLPVGSLGRNEAERELRDRWRPTIDSLRDEVLVLQANLVRLREGQRSVVESVSSALQNFVQNSGTSLLLAILTFLAVFFGLRAVVNRALRAGRAGRSFAVRLLEVVLSVVVVVAAVTATLLVPYARNDWFLLAIGIVFLLGVGWALVRMLPQFFEQIRLVLNIGGVREGERLDVDGLPFRVTALRFYTRLENPDLQGGVLRVPLQFLVGRRSRQSGPDEPWFPTRVGDVVLLGNGTCGRVLTQSPDVVVVEIMGAPTSMPTAAFLGLSPSNLSRGFTIDSTLTVARRHFDEVTSGLRERLELDLKAALATVAPAHLLRAVRVHFQHVTNNGFALLALADCDGAAAAHYFELRRTMQSSFVDACRQHGWTLPPPLVVSAPA